MSKKPWARAFRNIRRVWSSVLVGWIIQLTPKRDVEVMLAIKPLIDAMIKVED